MWFSSFVYLHREVVLFVWFMTVKLFFIEILVCLFAFRARNSTTIDVICDVMKVVAIDTVAHRIGGP